MKEKGCKECVQNSGGVWDSTSENDIAEGLCPKVRGSDVYV